MIYLSFYKLQKEHFYVFLLKNTFLHIFNLQNYFFYLRMQKKTSVF